ncbi:MAG: pantetheine-phosphate adenylyltransferase [Eggerthellaceae bacterium]|nr:pantetheine-phosphate adenylyltransferase [Eggerthellaceae bacterium]
MKIGLTPGTFDPITKGHIDIIERASHVVDQLIVSVAKSEKKHTLFTLEQRVELAREALFDFDNVEVEGFDGMLVYFAKEKGAKYLVKGLRAITDFEYEFQQTAVNSQLAPDIYTIFIMAPPQSMYLSSTTVRELASLKSDISTFVPKNVEVALKKKFDE